MRTVAEGFSVFLSSLTPTTSHREAAASHRASVKSALEAHFKVNNFFESGSFSNGTGIRYYSDVDAFVSIGLTKPLSADTGLGWVKSALVARFPNINVRVSRPAVVVEFANGSETWEVIPAFFTHRGGSSQLVYDIPGPSSGWIDSAPKEHLAYVNECNVAPSVGNAKALARLAKAWKYYCNVPISSFYLEMRAAQHVATQTTYIHVWDICQLFEKLQGHQLASMNDPKGASGRFGACSTEARKEEALLKLDTAATRARDALDAYNGDGIDTAFHYLELLFGGQFPSR